MIFLVANVMKFLVFQVGFIDKLFKELTHLISSTQLIIIPRFFSSWGPVEVSLRHPGWKTLADYADIKTI